MKKNLTLFLELTYFFFVAIPLSGIVISAVYMLYFFKDLTKKIIK